MCLYVNQAAPVSAWQSESVAAYGRSAGSSPSARTRLAATSQSPLTVIAVSLSVPSAGRGGAAAVERPFRTLEEMGRLPAWARSCA
jgi:hypothetical protein